MAMPEFMSDDELAPNPRLPRVGPALPSEPRIPVISDLRGDEPRSRIFTWVP